MPYVNKARRSKYLQLEHLECIETKGDLEYCLCRMIAKFMVGKEWRYANLHDAVYATMHAAHEFERRHLDARENAALAENGDVFGEDV